MFATTSLRLILRSVHTLKWLHSDSDWSIFIFGGHFKTIYSKYGKNDPSIVHKNDVFLVSVYYEVMYHFIFCEWLFNMTLVLKSERHFSSDNYSTYKMAVRSIQTDF